MRKVTCAVILNKDERRYRNQYRIPVSMLPGKFIKGSWVNIEIHQIDGGEAILALFSEGNKGNPESHVVTKKGQLTFTPPVGMLNEERVSGKKRYKTYKTAELPFEETLAK